MSNDKKQLLNESTVRRFMGLAGIGALSNTFVEENNLNEQGGYKPAPGPKKRPSGDPGGFGKIDTELPPSPGLGRKPKSKPVPKIELSREQSGDDDDGTVKSPGWPQKKKKGQTDLDEQDEMGLGPDEAELEDEEGFEDEEGEEGVEDVDLSMEEAEVLISLGRRLEGEMEGEMEGEEEMMGPGPEAAEMAMPPGPEAPMAEGLVRELTSRVSRRIKKEYVVNEVMKRVAGRLRGTTSTRRRRR